MSETGPHTPVAPKLGIFPNDVARGIMERLVSCLGEVELEMARYWWHCNACGEKQSWLTVCRSRSVAAFIWDELMPSKWDQRLLNPRCRCKRGSLRITYRLRRGDPELISVRHIVGLSPTGDYLPMLWGTFRHSKPRKPWIDFKYQKGRSPWGLTKRVVLERVQLDRLLMAYARAAGRPGKRLVPPERSNHGADT